MRYSRSTTAPPGQNLQSIDAQLQPSLLQPLASPRAVVSSLAPDRPPIVRDPPLLPR